MKLNSAIAILRREHNSILDMLDAAEEMAWQLERGERIPPESLEELMEFFRLFAEHCHCGKEEELLFPLLEKKGVPNGDGFLRGLLSEHQQGRALLREMEEASLGYARGDSGAGGRWAVAAREFVGVISGHIVKENAVLLPLTERMLSDAEQEVLAAAFEKIEELRMDAGTRQRLHAQMYRLLAEVFQGQV